VTKLCSVTKLPDLTVLKKKIWANFQRIIELFTQKIVTKLSKIWLWDPGSEIRKKPIPGPGSRGPGSGSATLNAAGRHLPLDAGEVNNNVDITLALQVADIRLLNGHGTLEEVLAPERQLLNNANLSRFSANYSSSLISKRAKNGTNDIKTVFAS
jgi:hypothetical protein